MRLLVCVLATVLCQAQTDTCTVEGQVFNHATGEPVRKAQIMLRSLGASSDQPFGAVTDASGRFAIAEIKPGRYILIAERSGFVHGEYGAQGPNRRGTTLTLTSGQRLKDVVFRLTPQGVIAGRVLDEDGEGVAGVSVQAMRYSYVQGKRTLLPAASAMTNDIGEYRLAGLAPGRYYLGATYRPMAMFSRAAAQDDYAPTYYPGTADPAAAAPVEVIAGNQFRGMDITLTRVRTVRVSGRITNAGGGSAGRNVMVFLMPREGGVRGYSSRNSTMVQDGRFEIRGVTPGPYLIAAHWYEDGQRYTASQHLDIGNAGLDGVTLTLAPGFEVPGRVRVEDVERPTLAGTQVALRPDNELAMGAAMGGRVGDDGSFVLSSVSPDHYRVLIFGMPPNYYLKAARLGDSDMLQSGATLTAGAGPLDIVLSAAGGQVDGVALDAKQQPAAGATVVLLPDARRSDRPELQKVATTDQQGSFSFRGTAPGDYRLFAWQEVEQGAWQDPEFLKPFEKDAVSVSVREHGRESVQLKLLAAEER